MSAPESENGPWWVEARARLDDGAVTEGEWRAEYEWTEGSAQDGMAWVVKRGPDLVAIAENGESDADLIANAPSDLRRALDVIDTIRALHQRGPIVYFGDDWQAYECTQHCDEPWPCPTVRLLDGSDE